MTEKGTKFCDIERTGKGGRTDRQPAEIPEQGIMPSPCSCGVPSWDQAVCNADSALSPYAVYGAHIRVGHMRTEFHFCQGRQA